MSTTDRSLWVEDKYALRCRGCGEKFTVFRRRHHCRRCGQVFCYECLHPPSAASTSQSIVANVYQWLTPATMPDAGPPSTVAPGSSSSSDRGLGRRTSATTNAAAELSVRLCRRCAATIIENAAREALVPHAEFQPSSLTLPCVPFVASSSPSPLLLGRSLPCSASTLLGTPLHTGSRCGGQLHASQRDGAPMPQNSPLALASPRGAAAAGAAADNNDAPAAAATVRVLEASAARHVETAEDREVTYAIGRVHRPAPSAMLQWWDAQRRATSEEKAARPRLDATAVLSTDALEAIGARLQTLSEPIEFQARFLLADDVAQSSTNGDAGLMGSAAVHAVVDPPPRLREFLHECGAACSTHLQTRIQHCLQVYFTQVRGARLSKHLADVAWHVVRQTAVALGATALDHVAVMSIAAAAMPAQCAVYPGLVNRRRLPTKRVMTACDHPRVLLLAGHLSYSVQPAEDLVDYVRSYSGYLDKLFQRLVVWRPDVVVVEGGMHHYLRERIEADGHMRLVLDVGRDFLVQLSWCLRAEIIADLQYVGVGDLATTAPMGRCARFEVLELAEEVHCCGFRGFEALTFHTVILRGGRLAGSVTARDTPSLARQWEVLEKVAKEAITVAYHLALQSHGALAIARDGAPLPVVHTTEVTSEEAAVAAAITMNAGCRFPAAVYAACRDLATPAALATLKDNLVVNVVHMDQLSEGSGTTVGRSAAVAAATAVMGTLTKSRSSDLAQERGGSRSSLPISHGGSHRDLSSPTAGCAASGVAGAVSGAGPLLSAAPSRPEATAANAYAVVQQKSALAFYGSGDETLFHFLVSRCTGAEMQVLYLHGGFRIKVTATTHATLLAAPSLLAESGLGGLLGAAQMTAFHKATVRQNAARALAGVEAMDAAAMTAFVAHLKGFFSLRLRAEYAGADASSLAAPLDASVDVCAPHLLNLSTAAFLEWVLYSWMPALTPAAAATAATNPALRITFQFHPIGPDPHAQQQPQQSQPSPPPHGPASSLAAQAYTNAVTFLVEPVQLGAVEFPPRVLPRVDARIEDGHDLDGRLAVDTLYAAQEASELATLVAELLQATQTSLQRAEQLESARAGVPAASPTPPPSTASSVEDVPGKATPANPSTAPGTALAVRPPAQVQLEAAAAALRQCMADAERALDELQGARQSAGGPLMAPLLAQLRQRLLPALIAAYRGWRNAHRRAAGRNGVSAGAAVVGGGGDVAAGTGGGSSGSGSGSGGATALQERPSCLRRLDGCLYHGERSQWIRLAEPTSILAAALLQLYRAAPPTGSGGGSPAPQPPPAATASAVKEPASPAPSTAASDAAAAAEGETKPSATQAAHVSFAIEPSPVAESSSPDSAPSPGGRWGPPPSLASACRLPRAAALEALRQTSRAEAAAPSAALKCAVTGYQPVVHDAGGGAMAALSSAAGVAAIMNGGGAEPSITVEVLFPRSFAALHVLYTDGAPFDICAALLRCRPYSADGGKSQSRFFVTQDGRFLIKAVKPTELRYFREWAPRYFARMADYFAAAPESRQEAPASDPAQARLCASSVFGVQSTLGKILGLYAVHVQGTRSRSSGPASATPADAAAAAQLPQGPLLADGTHCFMVAEQLLFGRPVHETWDLKGSQRNRTTEQTAAVRLDEDLVQERLRAGSFFFCSPESKSLLMDHLSRDTALLAESGIMDYSLMVSVGDAGRLYVGMIDFLHPYSSAKVLESKMKSGLDTMLGYTRRDPTIIDPASYAARFMLWMDGYFNGVPDRLFPLTRVRLLKERRESELADKKRQSPVSAP